MEIRNCRRCHRLFQYRGNKYCPACVNEIDRLFLLVREYIYENPDANIVKIIEETGVEEDLILQFLREGRLELKNPSMDFLCERCEKPITVGRFCSECQAVFEREMKKGLGASSNSSLRKSSKSERMYIADFHKRKR